MNDEALSTCSDGVKHETFSNYVTQYMKDDVLPSKVKLVNDSEAYKMQSCQMVI